MKVSLNWIKQFTEIDLSVDKLVDKIGAQLGAVDEVIDLGKKYEGAVIAKVVECVKHPNAYKLSLCLIDDAKSAKKVERNKEGLVQVVCGAPNVAAGQMVVWLPPGVTVPNTYDNDTFVLEARELRGKISNGMIASAKELALGDDHSGILVLDDKAKAGDSFAKAYGLDDHIIDIENKMFTHRPDLFGMLGIARELAGISGQPFKSPNWYEQDADLHNDGRKNVLKLSVKNELPELVPRFTVVAIKDVKVEESPSWLKIRLASVGVRPINNIVDLTNFFMLETAQPLHAYDYDKVKSGVLGVRQAKTGEKLKLIGGKEIKLTDKPVVITDGDKSIGLGGVMGGADTEVDENTKNIILECANFDMNLTRKTAMEYGLFTDAATRFTKNQSSLQQRAVLCKAVDDIKRIAGGRVASPIIDINHAKKQAKPVKVAVDFINQRLGLLLGQVEIKKLLQNVEFSVNSSGQELVVAAPFWRTDIEIPEDIVEEVGRLYGYDHLPLELPRRSIKAVDQDSELAFKATVRDYLASAGANEVLTYSFVHGSLLDKAGQKPAEAYHIRNALSPDLQYYRQSLTPSLLEKVHPNIKSGNEEFALFELGRAHVRGVIDDEGLPRELKRLGFVHARKQPLAGAPYYYARWFMGELIVKLGIDWQSTVWPVEEKKLSKAWQVSARAFEPVRSAVIYTIDHKEVIGIVGEPTSQLRQALKLPAMTSMFELDLDVLQNYAQSKPYRPINRYPATEQDITLKVAADAFAGDILSFVYDYLDNLRQSEGYDFSISILDIFQKDKATKNITFRVLLEHPDRTLTTAEVNKLFDILVDEAKKEFKAERV
jgi:phenylalanyl-tRNA synthetase beta chain